jgi:hypothetical protein
MRVRRHVDVQDAPPLQREEEEDVQHAEPHGRHREDVDRATLTCRPRTSQRRKAAKNAPTLTSTSASIAPTIADPGRLVTGESEPPMCRTGQHRPGELHRKRERFRVVQLRQETPECAAP